MKNYQNLKMQTDTRRKYKRIYQKEWDKKYPEKRNLYHRRWYARHIEKARIYHRDRMRKWVKANPIKARQYKRKTSLKTKFGLSLEGFEKLFNMHKGKCWVCNGPPTGRWKRLHVDHCHKTGKVRGLLCHNCNTALGHLRDSTKIIKSLLKYIRRTGE